MPPLSASSRVLEILRGEQPVLVLTGAGVSAESGLSTFRGPGGLWEGRAARELATPEAWSRDPLDVWRFYAWRRTQAGAAEPNAGHRAIAALQARRPAVALVTQNVDGLHQRAGSPRVVELHGSLWTLRCSREGNEREDRRADLGELPPRCSCGEPLRPGVVWFGEAIPPRAWEEAESAALAAALVIVAGTSSLVHPAAGLPFLAKGRGAYVVEVNPEVTALTRAADEHLAGPSGRILPVLLEAA